jgi:alpha-beta hydrolase superfamily lysophospholipase
LADSQTNPVMQSFQASDGYTFAYRRFNSKDRQSNSQNSDVNGQVKGKIIVIHGIRSHGGWYERSCQAWANAGFEVCLLDRRGAGLNQQARGDCPSFRRLLDDVSEFIAAERSASQPQQTSVPIFVVGISWGGKLAISLPYRVDFSDANKLAGIILVTPGRQNCELRFLD